MGNLKPNKSHQMHDVKNVDYLIKCSSSGTINYSKKNCISNLKCISFFPRYILETLKYLLKLKRSELQKIYFVKNVDDFP